MNMGKRIKSSMNLLRKKGHYLYEWVDCVENLDYTVLPPKEAFYSALPQEAIISPNSGSAQDTRHTGAL